MKDYSPTAFYAQSKFANVLFGLELHRRLTATGSPVHSLLAHPGYAATEPTARSGQFIGPDGRGEMRGHPTLVRAVPSAEDPATATRLWTLSEELTGVHHLKRVSG
ncbi:hypothetical protein E1258_18670 [Micromonospora sp. KC207]|uniref:hypothetical protein n=1 Tax=Micromonospora sp. KC207 TaxID=2530377 RepID=UPI00104C9EBD|nr:hypothetical protein [Micromonospora sp. KC207]TDC59240.1 hypothetical protein E1258_18670 [Micromonospora sp. KC207]